jgi:UDP-N-acetylmuramoyl-tripeptide--D-alanyl-D-alanine ligase
MTALARIVRPDVAIITALAQTHTNRYSDVAQIAREKSELVRYLKPKGLAILNGDDIRVRQMAQLAPCRPVFFGKGQHNGYVAGRIRHQWPDRLSLTVTDSGDPEQTPHCVQTNLVGGHWVNSVLAAIAAADVLGVTIPEAAKSIRKVTPFRGRMQPVRVPNGAVMIRDENGSLDVLKAMLDVARTAKAARRILVLGEVIDSGIVKSRNRWAMVGELVAPDVDAAVFIGESSRHATKAAVRAGLPGQVVFNVAGLSEADELLRTMIRPGDLVFVKGLGSQHLSRLVFAQLGQIRCHVERCKIRKDCDICADLQPSFDLHKALRWAD